MPDGWSGPGASKDESGGRPVWRVPGRAGLVVEGLDGLTNVRPRHVLCRLVAPVGRSPGRRHAWSGRTLGGPRRTPARLVAAASRPGRGSRDVARAAAA